MQINRHIKDESKRPLPLGAISIIFTATVILGVIMVSSIRSNSSKIYPSSRPETTLHDANAWIKAIENNNSSQAIILAKKLIPDDNPEFPKTDYISLMLQIKMSTLFLTSPFNEFDFMRWKDAMGIKTIVDSVIMDNDQSNIEILFKHMQKKVKLRTTKEKNYIPGVSLLDIWNRKVASTQELCRLFAAFARQAGYDAQIVTLFNQDKKITHLFCEIRKNSKSYVVDPRFGFIEANASANQYADKKSSMPKIWPEKVQNSINIRVYKLPAEPQDFKLFNQQLNKKLLSLGVSCAKFGNDPQTQIDEYIQKYHDKKTKSHYLYWTFPFHSLMSSLDFPKEWRLKYRKSIDM